MSGQPRSIPPVSPPPSRPMPLVGIVLAMLTCAFPVAEAGAQEPGAVQWSNEAELSFLMSGGNSSGTTFGLRNTLRRRAGPSELRLDVAGLRTDATRIRRTAVGTGPDDFRVDEERDRERTAERYSLKGRYDRELGENTFGFGGAGWTRNTFSGFEHRTVGFAGAGGSWSRDEVWELKLGLAVTYTVQRDVIPDPERDDSFAGMRVTLDHTRTLTSSTELEMKWVVDGNAQELSDVRADLAQSLSASVSERLALKTTLQLVAVNEPPLESLRLFLPDGTETDTSVLVPLGKLDHTLSVALVITL